MRLTIERHHHHTDLPKNYVFFDEKETTWIQEEAHEVEQGKVEVPCEYSLE